MVLEVYFLGLFTGHMRAVSWPQSMPTRLGTNIDRKVGGISDANVNVMAEL